MSRAEEVLEILKRRGPLSTGEVSRALGVSRQAAAMLLGRMAGEGLVVARSERRGVGRPRQVWALAAASESRFADAHAQLTVELIAAVREGFGDSGLDRLIALRERASEAGYRTVIGKASNLRTRVERLAAARSAEGYMAEVEEADGGLLLVENHCPICVAARVCQGFCRSELDVFRRVLGPDAQVERIDHIIAGARRCAYRVVAAA